MGLLDVAASVLTGGATGLLGSIVSRVSEYQAKKLECDHEVAMRAADAAIMAQEWAARTKIADTEADTKAFVASFNEPVRYSENVKPTERQSWLLILLDFIRGVVRPGLTLYLCALTTLIYFQARTLLNGEALSPYRAADLVNRIIETVLYLTSTCLLWWFGVRSAKK